MLPSIYNLSYAKSGLMGGEGGANPAVDVVTDLAKVTSGPLMTL